MDPKSRIALLVMPVLLGAAVPSKPDPASTAAFTVALSGHAERYVTHGWTGDIDGSGKVKLTVDLASQEICYDFNLSHLATPLMAHIDRGPAIASGPSVVTLFTGPGGNLDDCVPWTEKWLTEIVAHPSNFHVNLYTTEYPDGAVRGQLQG